MRVTHKIGGQEVEFDLTHPIDLSIPIHFGGPQPNAYGVEPATSEACEYGDLVGDTRRGGGCNFEQYTIIPHCNGTHTECVGHITDKRISVRDCLQDTLIPSALISVPPVRLADSGESYPNQAEDDDPVITSASISERIPAAGIRALIVRTLPNSESKLAARYRDDVPPYFTSEAIRLLDDLNIDHLICDLPSIDRLYDGGRLANHRIFWQVEADAKAAGPKTLKDRTITELIYAPDEAADGIWLVNLQIAPFASDAAPSRPVIFPLARRG